ncbi:MAG: hypothetical protein OEZ58_13980 [Gammaproteobacteria bacterium]|nr:hypothetical protein [Gammaproteobacteria bacterium]MDH5730099.1 hypothetical protein [Gammaproteobacteria bacterium]
MQVTKRIAMVLYSLDPKDQQWLLESIPDLYQPAIETALEELESIGIPKDELLLQQVLQTCDTSLQKKAFSATSLEEEILAKVKLLDVQAILDSESIHVSAQVVNMKEWPWKAEYINQSKRRRQLKVLTNGDDVLPRLPGKLQASLIRALVLESDPNSISTIN